MFIALGVLTLLGLSIGTLLAYADRFLAIDEDPLALEIQNLMPGTQCGQCGFPGCTPAAEAIANHQAPVTSCPPGGRQLADTLAEMLGVDLDVSEIQDKLIAHIVEAECTGCTRCYKVCPTDAIMGANKQMHSVFAAACTGCGNCLDACPEDCIVLAPESINSENWQWPRLHA
jgi:electron transport complex protein RnfB